MVGLPQARKDNARLQSPVTTPCISSVCHWAKYGYNKDCSFPNKNTLGLAEYHPDINGNQVRTFTCFHCMSAGSKCLELPESVTKVVPGQGNPLAFELELAILRYHNVALPGEMLGVQPSSCDLAVQTELIASRAATDDQPAVTRGYRVVSGVVGRDLSQVDLDHVKDLSFTTSEARKEHFRDRIQQLCQAIVPIVRNLMPWTTNCRGHSGRSAITGGTIQFAGRAPRGKAAKKRSLDDPVTPRSAGRKKVKMTPQSANQLVVQSSSSKNHKIQANDEDIKCLIHNMVINARAIRWITEHLDTPEVKVVKKKLRKDFNMVSLSGTIRDEMNEDEQELFEFESSDESSSDEE